MAGLGSNVGLTILLNRTPVYPEPMTPKPGVAGSIPAGPV